MKALQQFFYLLGFLFISRLLTVLLHIPVPSTIVAMLLLLAMLELGIVKAHCFEEIQKFLLQHILLFLIPVALSFVGVLHLLQDTWLRLLVIIIVSSTVTFVVTARTIDRMIGKENKHVRSDTVD